MVKGGDRMKYTYEIEMCITYKKECEPLKVTIKDNDLDSLKGDMMPTIDLVCYEHGVRGEVFVEITITKNGEYFDRDESFYTVQ